jgi:Fe-S cluster assembly protein SufD
MAVITDLKEKFLGIFDEQNIEEKSPFAKEALRLLEEMQLPNQKQEEWKYTPVAKFLDKDYQLGENYTNLDTLKNELDLPADAYLLVFVNGFFAKELSFFDESEFLLKTKASPCKSAELEGNFFTCLNVLFAEEGVQISVPKNKKVSKPVWVRSITLANENPIFSQLSHHLILEQGAEMTLIEDSKSNGEKDIFQNHLLIAHIDSGAKLTHFKLQTDKKNAHQVSRSNFLLKKDAQLHDFVFTFSKGFVRNNLDIKLDENNEVFLNGLTILGENAFADHHTVADHKKPHSYSNQFYKGIYSGAAHGVFNGKIFVRPDAQKTNAFQANRSILLSEKARIDAKPQLEIFADDVKCSHGATTGMLDEDALFYLRARGIPFAEARKLLLTAFAAEVFDKIEQADLRKFIESESVNLF